MNNELLCTIENLFDDFTIHPSGAYVIEHMQDTAVVFLPEKDEKAGILFGTGVKMLGTESAMANALRAWRNRAQL